jgi:hypothetical protein
VNTKIKLPPLRELLTYALVILSGVIILTALMRYLERKIKK